MRWGCVAFLTIKILPLHWDKITPKSWQKHKLLVNFYLVIPPNQFLSKILAKKSSQKSSQKILPKNLSQKIPPKIFLQKNLLPKKFQQNPKNFQTISQNNSMIFKISNSLHRTWRPKTISGLFVERLCQSVKCDSFRHILWHCIALKLLAPTKF